MTAINHFTHKLIVKVFHLLHKELNAASEKAFRQFLLFCLVSMTNTVVSYGVYAATLSLFRQISFAGDYSCYLSQVLSYVVSVLWSFFWNNRLVFEKSRSGQRNLILSLMKAFMTYGFTGLILNNIMLCVWVNLLGISAFAAPLLSLCITFPINYLLNKFWAFREKKPQSAIIKNKMILAEADFAANECRISA